MKKITIIVTKEDTKKSVRFYKFWAIAFLFLTILSLFIALEGFIFFVIGLFFSFFASYFSSRDLKKKEQVVSKTVADVVSIKNSLWYLKIVTIFWLFLVGFVVLTTKEIGARLGILSLTIFFLTILLKRMRTLSTHLKKK